MCECLWALSHLLALPPGDRNLGASLLLEKADMHSLNLESYFEGVICFQVYAIAFVGEDNIQL